MNPKVRGLLNVAQAYKLNTFQSILEVRTYESEEIEEIVGLVIMC